MTSTCASSVIRWPTAARSVVATSCTACSGRPACAQALAHAARRSPRLLRIASEPPRRIVALPDLRHSAAASAVTFGPRFVDDADHAERHAHLADLDAGRAGSARSVISPTGSGSAAISSSPRAIASIAVRVERQAVDERGVVPRRARGGDVLRVGGEQCAGFAPDRARRRSQRRVLRVRGSARDLARRGARGFADAAHVLGNGRRHREIVHDRILARARWTCPAFRHARNGSMTSRNGKRWKSVSRVQIREIPCSRISTAVCASCITLPARSGN